MKSDFELILEECLAQMRTGKALEECLSAHPVQAKRLRPLLEAAVRVWVIPIPRARPEAVQAGLERLLAGASTQKVSPTVSPSPVSSGRIARYTKQILGTLQTFPLGKEHSSLNLAFRMAAILVIVLLATGGITVKASAGSLPGDRLYTVKRTWESIRISLTLNQIGKQRLVDRFAEERRDEVKQLIYLRRAETVEFQAPLEAIDAEHWQVNGFQVHIDPETDVEGLPETGAPVDVRARLEQDGTLIAIQVRIPTQQPTPFPPSIPTPRTTPSIDENPEDPGSENPQYQQLPADNPESPAVHEPAEENKEIAQPTRQPEQDATQTPQFRPTHTPEPTIGHENEDAPEPTEVHNPTRTPEHTQQHHETPEPTDEH